MQCHSEYKKSHSIPAHHHLRHLVIKNGLITLLCPVKICYGNFNPIECITKFHKCSFGLNIYSLRFKISFDANCFPIIDWFGLKEILKLKSYLLVI